MAINASEQILELAAQTGLLRAKQVREMGASPQLLIKLHRAGKLQRVARGLLYGLPDHAATAHQPRSEACQRVPKAVLCLLSALQFHDIGTQQPHELWIALPEGTSTSRLGQPHLRVTRLRGNAYSEGIETHFNQGTPIRVYSVAKTIADCGLLPVNLSR